MSRMSPLAGSAPLMIRAPIRTEIPPGTEAMGLPSAPAFGRLSGRTRSGSGETVAEKRNGF